MREPTPKRSELHSHCWPRSVLPKLTGPAAFAPRLPAGAAGPPTPLVCGRRRRFPTTGADHLHRRAISEHLSAFATCGGPCRFCLMEVYGAVWSHDLRLRFRGSLLFMERHYATLRKIEERWKVEFLDVQGARSRFFIEESVEVDLSSGGVSIVSLGDSIPALVDELAALLDEDFDVKASRALTRSQCILPLDSADYDSTRRAAAQAWLRGVPVEDATDSATMMDGKSSRLSSDFQVEYGVVSEAEIPLRIARAVGRMARSGGAETLLAESMISRRQLPSAAVFTDFTWNTDTVSSSHPTSASSACVWAQETGVYAQDFAEQLHTALQEQLSGQTGVSS